MDLLALFGIDLNPLSYLGSFIDGMFSASLKLFGQSASDVVTALLGFMTTTSDPIFSSGWWSSSGEAVFVRVLAVAGALMALAFMLSVVTALHAGDAKLLMKAVLHLPLAVIQMGLLVTVTAALLSATDEVSSYIASGASQSLKTFVAADMIAAVADASIVGLVISALIILAAISVWLQLIVRTALLYVTVLGAPLVFAASVHPSVRGLQKRYIEFGVGLICAKVVIALAFATGAAALGSLGSSPSFSAEVGALLEALAILLIACFAPYLFIRLLIGVEALLITEGLERRPLRAAMHSQQASYYVRSGGGLSGLLHGMGGGGKGGGANPPRPDAGAPSGPASPGGDGGGGGSSSVAQPGPSPNGGSPRPHTAAGAAAAAAAGGSAKPAPPSGLNDARVALPAATTKGSRSDAVHNGAHGESTGHGPPPESTAPPTIDPGEAEPPSGGSSTNGADRSHRPPVASAARGPGDKPAEQSRDGTPHGGAPSKAPSSPSPAGPSSARSVPPDKSASEPARQTPSSPSESTPGQHPSETPPSTPRGDEAIGRTERRVGKPATRRAAPRSAPPPPPTPTRPVVRRVEGPPEGQRS